MNRAPDKKQTLIAAGLFLYVPIIAYFITNAVRQDQLYDIQSQLARSGNAITATGDGEFNIRVLFLLLGVYFVRAGLLVWMMRMLRPERRYGVIKAVLLTCLIPEVLIISKLFPKYDGPQNGLLSPYGDLQTLFIVFIALSVLLQAVSMLVAGLAARKRSA